MVLPCGIHQHDERFGGSNHPVPWRVARTFPIQLLWLGRSRAHARGVVLAQTVAVDVLLRLAAWNPPAVPLRPVHEPGMEGFNPHRFGVGRCGLDLSGCAPLWWAQPGCHGGTAANPDMDAAGGRCLVNCHGDAAFPPRTTTRTRIRN